jgi:hypothetical protein
LADGACSRSTVGPPLPPGNGASARPPRAAASSAVGIPSRSPMPLPAAMRARRCGHALPCPTLLSPIAPSPVRAKPDRGTRDAAAPRRRGRGRRSPARRVGGVPGRLGPRFQASGAAAGSARKPPDGRRRARADGPAVRRSGAGHGAPETSRALPWKISEVDDEDAGRSATVLAPRAGGWRRGGFADGGRAIGRVPRQDACPCRGCGPRPEGSRAPPCPMHAWQAQSAPAIAPELTGMLPAPSGVTPRSLPAARPAPATAPQASGGRERSP